MADFDLLAALAGTRASLESELDSTRERVNGVTLGVVTDLDDPLMLGRVKVSLPWLSEVVESAWARVVVLWAGSDRGSYFPPEVDDDVLVAFRHGDLAHPYVLGQLWSTKRRPPHKSARLERRGLKSKSGHELRFEELTGSGAVRLKSASGHELTLDDSTGKASVKIEASGGQMKVELDATSNTITITSNAGGISLKAPAGKVSVQSAGFDVNSTGPVQIQSSAAVTIKGATVAIN
jgi:uncharacterized protein involved in type VI secretion and phage assembly